MEDVLFLSLPARLAKDAVADGGRPAASRWPPARASACGCAAAGAGQHGRHHPREHQQAIAAMAEERDHQHRQGLHHDPQPAGAGIAGRKAPTKRNRRRRRGGGGRGEGSTCRTAASSCSRLPNGTRFKNLCAVAGDRGVQRARERARLAAAGERSGPAPSDDDIIVRRPIMKPPLPLRASAGLRRGRRARMARRRFRRGAGGAGRAFRSPGSATRRNSPPRRSMPSRDG